MGAIAGVGAKSMARSVGNKVAQNALKCPTSAGIVVGTAMSLVSNAADLCDPSKREAAAKEVAKDSAWTACAGVVARGRAGHAPGAVGAAVQVAAAVPDVVEAFAKGDTERAGKVAGS